MGASESIQVTDDEEQEQEDINDHNYNETTHFVEEDGNLFKNVPEQDPETLPSPWSLSPQLSSFSTPRFDPSIKDLKPFVSSESINDDQTITEIYVICHGECHMKLKPDLVGGRCPEAALTPKGKRQARALAVFLKSQGIQFSAIYTSPLDRTRATAIPVCQEINFPEHKIQTSNALNDMSQGIWEGRHQSDVYTPSVVSVMERFQPDFCAPSGETLRQVEFRMIEFLNATVMCLPEKPPQLDLPMKPRQGPPKRKSSKSRLHMVRTSVDHEADDEMSPRVPTKHHEHKVCLESSLKKISNNNNKNKNDNNSNNHDSSNNSSFQFQLASSCCIGIFSHAVPITCLVTGILGCSPIMSNKICIQDSSITVLQYSRRMGWQIKRVNDTCHLRLM